MPLAACRQEGTIVMKLSVNFNSLRCFGIVLASRCLRLTQVEHIGWRAPECHENQPNQVLHHPGARSGTPLPIRWLARPSISPSAMRTQSRGKDLPYAYRPHPLFESFPEEPADVSAGRGGSVAR